MGNQADYSPRGRAGHRRRGPQAHRGRPHRGLGDPHRVPRRARHRGRRTAGEGNPAPRRAGGDLRRCRKAAPADACSTTSVAAFRRTSRRSRRRASWPSNAASRGLSRCPSRRSRRPSPRRRRGGAGGGRANHLTAPTVLMVRQAAAITARRWAAADATRLRCARGLARARLASHAQQPPGYWYPPPSPGSAAGPLAGAAAPSRGPALPAVSAVPGARHARTGGGPGRPAPVGDPNPSAHG